MLPQHVEINKGRSLSLFTNRESPIKAYVRYPRHSINNFDLSPQHNSSLARKGMHVKPTSFIYDYLSIKVVVICIISKFLANSTL
jgi:hypothetical protein